MPVEISVTVAPLMLHTDGDWDEKVTARPELALATTAKGAVPKG
jgi:hypothetical protein